jgi:transposase
VLCELARTDRHRFRILEPDLDETKALRALVRAREDLVGARVALANQLCAELERFWPGPIGLFCDLDSPISLAFLARYPSPTDARALGEKRLAGFLKGQRYNNRKTPAQLLGRLRSAPSGRAGKIETRQRRSVVLRLVCTLQVMVKQIAELDGEITEALDAHPDGEIFRSFFRRRDSVICAATLLAEIGDCRGRYPHRAAIAADGGQAPVAKESGKRKHAQFRRACNKRLRNALSTLAHSSRISNPWAADRYASVATTTAARYAPSAAPGAASSGCWQNRTPYDPQQHTGLQQHIKVTIPDASGPQPDLAATQRMADAAVTPTAARRAEREAFDGKPPAAISTAA